MENKDTQNDVKLFIESHVYEKILQKTIFDKAEIIDGDHGRVEARRYWITDEITWLTQKKNWPGLTSIGMVEYDQVKKSTGENRVERRFFIASLAAKAIPWR